LNSFVLKDEGIFTAGNPEDEIAKVLLSILSKEYIEGENVR